MKVLIDWHVKQVTNIKKVKNIKVVSLLYLNHLLIQEEHWLTLFGWSCQGWLHIYVNIGWLITCTGNYPTLGLYDVMPILNDSQFLLIVKLERMVFNLLTNNFIEFYLTWGLFNYVTLYYSFIELCIWMHHVWKLSDERYYLSVVGLLLVLSF